MSPTPRCARDGFTRLRGDIWRADPALWDSADWLQDVAVDLLSLEDIFLAFARTDNVPT